MASSTPPLVHTLPDARWSCRSCGHCCRDFDLGPVEPPTFAALVAADPPSFWPPAAAQPWYELRQGPDGSSDAWLAHRQGSCIFLDDQRRCAIHAHLGPAAKPAFCREFPFHLVHQRSGYAAIVRPTCAGLHLSCQDGEPLDAQVQELPELPRAYPVARFEPDSVEILPGVGLDASGWHASEPAILRLLLAPLEDPRLTVAQLRQALARATGRALPPPDAQRYHHAVLETLQLLASALRPLATQTDSPRAALPALAVTWIERAIETPPQGLLPMGADACGYLNGILRSLVFGRLFHRQGGLPRSMGQLLVDLHMARSVALDLSPDAGPEPAALASVLAPWWGLAAHGALVQATRQAGPKLDSVFLNA